MPYRFESPMTNTKGKRMPYCTVHTDNHERLRKYAPYGMFGKRWGVWCVWQQPLIISKSED